MDISIQAKTAPALQLELSKHANHSHNQAPRASYVQALQTHHPRACQLLNMGYPVRLAAALAAPLAALEADDGVDTIEESMRS